MLQINRRSLLWLTQPVALTARCLGEMPLSQTGILFANWASIPFVSELGESWPKQVWAHCKTLAVESKIMNDALMDVDAHLQSIFDP